MIILRAHFDGRVLVPDEPVDLPQGRTLEIQVREVEPGTHPLTGLPVFKVEPGAKTITSGDVRRALEDEF